MNNGPFPAREIAHFVAKILTARPTTSDEVPELMARIRDTVSALRDGETRLLPTSDSPPRAKREARTAAPAVAAPRRKREKPVAVKPLHAAVAPEPVLPRLMRRAEVAPIAESTPFDVATPQNATLRGVVRWFDLNTRQGTLRLPGFGDEVTIDAAALERAGISRLYKGQEIAATVVADNGNVRLVSLALPGRVEADGHGLFKAGAARRNAKPVVVEMKRDAMRRTAARIEAEHILGNGRDGAG